MAPERHARQGTDASFRDPSSRESSPRNPMSGRLLDGRYQLGERIARGGMASVYTATDLRLDRTVAVKIMHPGLGDDTEFAARFVGEARAAARLSHPNVVAVYDQGEDDGTVFLAMELVSGHTLRDAIAQKAPISPLHAMALLAPIVDALASAHKEGLIHRDVKPENVLIAEDGRIKVADFGLAKAMSSVTQHTATGMLIGTVSYVAPEIVTEGRSDARGDVYAVGVILYELLTGHKPHSGETPIQIAYKHVHQDVPAPSSATPGIPPYVDALVARATSRDPELRPADARVLKHHLERVRSALAAGLGDDPELTADLHPHRSRRSQTPAPPHDVGSDTQEILREDTSPRSRSTLTPPPPRTTAAPAPLPTPAADEDPWEHSALAAMFGPPEATARSGRATATAPTQPVRPPNDRRPTRPRQPTRAAAPPPPPPVTAPHRPRRSRKGPILLVLALAVAAAVGVGGWWFGSARYTVTPGVLGLEQAAAQQRLDRVGLEAGIGDRAYSDTVAEGSVIASDPEPGQRILDGGTVEVTISLGVEEYDVPALRGLTEDQAQDELDATRLSFGTSREQFSENVASGIVLSSTPQQGKTVRPGTAVNLVVSKGRKPIKVGNWVGRDAEDAAGRLIRRGLAADTSAQEYSDTVPAGDVIRQSPEEGTLFAGETVSLVVSQGPELATVPDGLISSGVEAATAALQAAGFEVAVEESDAYIGLGYVLNTSPGSGERIPVGSTVTLFLV